MCEFSNHLCDKDPSVCSINTSMSSPVLNIGEMMVNKRIRCLECSLLLERERNLDKSGRLPRIAGYI